MGKFSCAWICLGCVVRSIYSLFCNTSWNFIYPGWLQCGTTWIFEYHEYLDVHWLGIQPHFPPRTGNRIVGRGILLWRSMSLNFPGWQILTVCPKPRDGVDVGKLDDIMLYLDFSLKPVVKFAFVIYIALCKHHYVKPLWELLLI